MTTLRYPYDDEPIELIAKQMQLELDVREAGAVRYQKQLDHLASQGKLENSSFAARIIANKIDPVAVKLVEFCKKDTGKAGVNHISIPFLSQADPKVCAMLGLKAVLARILGEAPTVTSIAISIGKSVEEETRLTKMRAVDRKCYNGVMKASADKNRSKSRSRTATFLADRSSSSFEWADWPDRIRAHVGMVILTTISEETGLFKFETLTKGGRRSNVVVPTEDARDWITKNINFMQFVKPQLEPMVVKPKPWVVGELDGGYLTSHVPVQPFVKTRNKRYLEELKYADMERVTRAVTAAQNVPWRINKHMLQLIADAMSTNLCIAGLPRKDYLDTPPKPYDISENEESRRRWAIAARKVHEENVRIMSKKISVTHTLNTARRYAEFERIYFPANVDFRCRLYYLTQLSPQGPDFIKSLLQFSEGKRIGDEGIPWLKYHIANLFGHDKISQKERVEWVDANLEELMRGVNTPFGEGIMWHTADEPLQAYAALLELKGVLENGPDHITRIPIALDGSCSGIQHLSMAFRDEIGGAAVNLVPQDKPADIYTLVAEETKRKLNDIAAAKTEDSVYAQWWLDFGIDRKVCKRNCMTFPYSSKERGFTDQILEDTLRPAELEGLEYPDGLNSMKLASFLAKLNYQSVKATVVKAGEAMEWMSNAARKVAKQNLPISWITPLGFPVVQAYRNYKPIRVETNLNGKRITMSLQEEELTIDSQKSASAISPNNVHSLDASHLMLVVDNSAKEGINSLALIHDSFGTHACDTPRFAGVIRESFVELYEDDVFGKFKEQLEAQLPDGGELDPLPEKGNLDPELVLESHYAFA